MAGPTPASAWAGAMWKARTLTAYLLREVLLYSALGIAGVCLVFLTTNLRRFLDELIGIGFRGADVLALLRCLLGMVASYVLPIAFLFGTLLAIGRKSADREIAAMHACGLGLSALVIPIFALGCLVSGVTWYLAIEVEHRARHDLRALVKNLATRATRLEPGQFSKLGPRVVWVQDSDASGLLHGVLISDRSDVKRPLLIAAESGRFSFDEEANRFEFQLENGDIHIEPGESDAPIAAGTPAGPTESEGKPDDRYQRIAFRSFDYAFDASHLFHVHQHSYRRYDMSLSELRNLLARAEAGDPLTEFNRGDKPVDYAIEIQRRFALPVAPMLFALIAVPLGTRVRRGARSLGVLIALVIAFGYYIILVANEHLARQGVLAPAVALWLPNAVFAAMAVALLYNARRREI